MKNSGNLVLIIEDNESNMELLHGILEMRGYNVLQASNGTEGWQSACKHHPDLILMDIRLPDVSGLDVTRWLKDDETLKSIPIIAITAFALNSHEQEMLDGGCDAYIAKPISVPKLMQTVERLVAEREPNPSECDLEPVQSMK